MDRHDLVAEFEDLVSNSAGEDLDRHVVVYRRGHEPEGFVSNSEERMILKARKGGRRAATTSKASAHEDPATYGESVRPEPIRDAVSVFVIK